MRAGIGWVLLTSLGYYQDQADREMYDRLCMAS